MDTNYRPYLAELIGTFVLVFIGTGAVCVNQLAAVPYPLQGADQPAAVPVQAQPGLVGVALACGLAYAVALAATLPLSGGFLNPAVTLMLWVFKRLDGIKTTFLIFAQIVGAALAGGLVRLVFAFNEIVVTGARVGTPHVNLPPFGQAAVTRGALLSGIGIEIGLTFVLTFVIFATLIDPRAPRLLGRVGKWLAPLWVGLALVVVTLVGFNLTGAAVNPARWFGCVIWETTLPTLVLRHPFADHMVYWIGPIVGALLAGGVYNALLLPQEEEHKAGTPSSGTKVAAGASSTLFRAKRAEAGQLPDQGGSMRPLTQDDLLPLDEYAERRPEFFESLGRYLDRYRRVRIGPDVTLLFENRQTLWFRLQEILRIARLAELDRVQEELDLYNRLLPGRGQLQSALLIGGADEVQRTRSWPLWKTLPGEALRFHVGRSEFPAHLVTCRPEDHCIGAAHWVQFDLGEAGRQLLADFHQSAHFQLAHDSYQHHSPPLSEDVRQSLLDDLQLSEND